MFVLSCSTSLLSQCPETNPNCNQVVNWIFGDSVWLYFNDTGIVQRKSPISTREASSVIVKKRSDSVLLYGTPEIIYNSDGSILNDSLKGNNSSVQGSLFLRRDNDSIIHYFTGENFSSFYRIGLYHHTAIGTNIVTNRTILHPATEQLTSINQQNNKDFWLITHKGKSDSFYIFPVTQKGVLCPNILKEGGDYLKGQGTPYTNGVQIKINPQGNKVFALRSENDFSGKFRVDLFKFNKESGLLYDNIDLAFFVPFHANFSPNGDKLYITNSKIFQYSLMDFSLNSILNSETQITTKGNNSKGDLNIAPNGKIYIAYSDSTHLGVINFPDNDGTACDFEENGLELLYGKSRYGLPNFNQSYFYTPSIDFAYTENCWSHRYQFEGRDTFKATQFKWLFQKDSTRDSILTKHCSYQFSDTGKWKVCHIASNGTRTDTITKTLTIYPQWQKDMLGTDTFNCQGSDFNLVLNAPENMHCVHWMGEEPNLDETEGELLDYNHFHVDTFTVDTAGVYVIKATNKTFCQVWDTITVVEKPRPQNPIISVKTEELASTIKSYRYRWFLNDTFLLETENRSITPNRNQYYQVQLISEFGCESERSDSFLVDFVSVKDILDINQFKIYPNPSEGDFTIHFDKPDDYTVEVFEMTGSLIMVNHLGNSVLHHLSIKGSGNYMVKISSKNGYIGQRIVQVK